MLVLTPKYGSQTDIDHLKKQKSKTKKSQITHRNDIIYLTHCKNIKEAYQTFLTKKDKYFLGYKPEDAEEINDFVHSLGEIDTLDVRWIDVSDLKSLEYCFQYCRAKHIVGLEKWDVSNVKDMHHMFCLCEKLESICHINEWDVSNVNFMYCMFYGCGNLESIGDLSGWDVSNVTHMNGLFYGCKKLESIGDISEWDVSNIQDMIGMFKTCENLKYIGDIERWNIPGNVDTRIMFDNCAITPIPSWYHE